jgi:hypothetical protein
MHSRDAFRGLSLAIQIHPTYPDAEDEPAADRLAALYPDWSQRLVTSAAVGLGVLVVTLIAVVMGMA